MITLDYTTYNPHWKHSGIRYSSWEAFAFALGYLANRLHYRNINDSGLIELHLKVMIIKEHGEKKEEYIIMGNVRIYHQNFQIGITQKVQV